MNDNSILILIVLVLGFHAFGLLILLIKGIKKLFNTISKKLEPINKSINVINNSIINGLANIDININLYYIEMSAGWIESHISFILSVARQGRSNDILKNEIDNIEEIILNFNKNKKEVENFLKIKRNNGYGYDNFSERRYKEIEITLNQATKDFDIVSNKYHKIKDKLNKIENINKIEDDKELIFLLEDIKKYKNDIKNECEEENIIEDKKSSQKIESYVSNREIKYLFHFTNVKNLDSIITHGLLPKSHLAKNSIKAICNDALRLDGHDEAISLSISFPNYKMFYKYRKLNEATNEQWCVIILYSKVLFEKECLFCKTNAANNIIRHMPNDELKGYEAFIKLFGDEEERSKLELPVCHPTDEQAEVLVRDIIDISYIREIHFNNKNVYKKFYEKYSNFDFRLNDIFFNSRNYYLNSYRRK